MPIEGKLFIPDNKSSAANIYVALNGAEYEAISRNDGSFQFKAIPSGIYAVEVLSVNHSFPQMKIKVNAEDKVVNVVEYKYPGAKKSAAEYPLQLKALYPIRYYQEHPPFSIIRLITGNPMIVMMVVSLGVMLLFPTLLKGINPEEMKQMQEEMNISGDPYTELKKMVMGGGNKGAEEDGEDDK